MPPETEPIQSVGIGPLIIDQEMAAGDCPDCGGQCAPECGLHPAGCVFGGFGYGYWLIADGCDLDHGERSA